MDSTKIDRINTLHHKAQSVGLTEEEKKEANKPDKSFVYDNIKKIADVWDNIDKTQKNKILRIIIDKVVIVNDDVKIFLRDF